MDQLTAVELALAPAVAGLGVVGSCNLFVLLKLHDEDNLATRIGWTQGRNHARSVTLADQLASPQRGAATPFYHACARELLAAHSRSPLCNATIVEDWEGSGRQGLNGLLVHKIIFNHFSFIKGLNVIISCAICFIIAFG